MPLQFYLVPPSCLNFLLCIKSYFQIQSSHFSNPLQNTLSKTPTTVHSLHPSCSPPSLLGSISKRCILTCFISDAQVIFNHVHLL